MPETSPLPTFPSLSSSRLVGRRTMQPLSWSWKTSEPQAFPHLVVPSRNLLTCSIFTGYTQALTTMDKWVGWAKTAAYLTVCEIISCLHFCAPLLPSLPPFIYLSFLSFLLPSLPPFICLSFLSFLLLSSSSPLPSFPPLSCPLGRVAIPSSWSLQL